MQTQPHTAASCFTYVRSEDDLKQLCFEVRRYGKAYKQVMCLADFITACDVDNDYITPCEIAEIAANGGAHMLNGDMWFASKK